MDQYAQLLGPCFAWAFIHRDAIFSGLIVAAVVLVWKGQFWAGSLSGLAVGLAFFAGHAVVAGNWSESSVLIFALLVAGGDACMELSGN